MLLMHSTSGYRLNPAQWEFKCLATKEVQIETSAQCTIVFSLIIDNDEFKSESSPLEKKRGNREGRGKDKVGGKVWVSEAGFKTKKYCFVSEMFC